MRRVVEHRATVGPLQKQRITRAKVENPTDTGAMVGEKRRENYLFSTLVDNRSHMASNEGGEVFCRPPAEGRPYFPTFGSIAAAGL